MSKLTEIKETLELNPEVGFWGVGDKKFWPDMNNKNIIQRIDIYVAPKNGLYKPPELNDFMSRLVLNQTSNGFLYAHYYRTTSGGLLVLGNLTFNEEVGRAIATREIQIDDPELQNLERLINGKMTEELGYFSHPILRVIKVRPMPNEAYVMDLLSGKIPEHIYTPSEAIPFSTLKQYKEISRGENPTEVTHSV